MSFSPLNTIPFLLVFSLALAAGAHAQVSRSRPFGLDRNVGSVDSFGKPCITDVQTSAYAVPSSSTKLIEQTAVMTNTCLKKLRVRVCYRGSQKCKVADLPAREKTQIVLGYEPNGTFFLFDYKEVPLSYAE